MIKLSNNKEIAQKLIQKGEIIKNKFSWDLTAAKLWQTIEKTLLS